MPGVAGHAWSGSGGQGRGWLSAGTAKPLSPTPRTYSPWGRSDGTTPCWPCVASQGHGQVLSDATLALNWRAPLGVMIVRIAFVVLTIFSGAGIPLYLAGLP